MNSKISYIHPTAIDTNHISCLLEKDDEVNIFNKLNSIIRIIFVRNSTKLIIGSNLSKYSYVYFLFLIFKKNQIILRVSSIETNYVYRALLAILIRRNNVHISFTTFFCRNYFSKKISHNIFKCSSVSHHVSSVAGLIERKNIIKRKYDFAFFARLEDVRGINEFIYLAKKYPEFSFVIAGKGSLKEYIRKEELNTDNITFLDFVKDDRSKLELIRETKCLINLMKKHENFGISILEFASNGSNVLSFYDYGPLELNTIYKINFIDCIDECTFDLLSILTTKEFN